MQSLFFSKIVAQNWIGTSGPNVSVPVLAQVNGLYQNEDKFMNADITFVFSDFKTDYPDFYLFEPPSDMWCQGRTMNQELWALPEFYSYTSEAMFYVDLPISTGGHQDTAFILSTRQEYYDFKQQG